MLSGSRNGAGLGVVAYASKKAFILSARLISTWATQGWFGGKATVKYLKA